MMDTQTATDQPDARHTAAGDGEAYWFFDSLMVIQADQPGQPVIIEATVAPGGGAPLHVHADLDDSFYLVSGRLAVRCGEQTFVADPGGYVALPHGVPHTFRVVGEEPAVMLQVHTDDSFLRFIRDAGRPAASRTLPPAGPPIDLDAAFEVAARTGQPVVGPPMSEDEAALIAARPPKRRQLRLLHGSVGHRRCLQAPADHGRHEPARARPDRGRELLSAIDGQPSSGLRRLPCSLVLRESSRARSRRDQG